MLVILAKTWKKEPLESLPIKMKIVTNCTENSREANLKKAQDTGIEGNSMYQRWVGAYVSLVSIL